jgi:GNAT superfamily N-acetyltransferase
MGFEIRRIRPDEGLRLRALRLHALADAPKAFGSTLAHEAAFPEDVWHERAAGGAAGDDRVTFVAELDGRWVGLATGFAADSGRSEPMLIGMFVDGTARRRGVGVALVESVIGWARARQASRLILWATAGNEAAIALYERCGFRPTGASRSLAHDPTLVEVEMVCDLA